MKIISVFHYASFGLGLPDDVNISGLNAVTNGRGGFEVALKYKFNKELVAKNNTLF